MIRTHSRARGPPISDTLEENDFMERKNRQFKQTCALRGAAAHRASPKVPKAPSEEALPEAAVTAAEDECQGRGSNPTLVLPPHWRRTPGFTGKITSPVNTKNSSGGTSDPSLRATLCLLN